MPFKDMKIISQYLIFATVFISTDLYSQVSQKAGKQVSFCPPLNIPLMISGNYGEIRSSHFHTGIDFKTGGVEGKEVLAADTGYIFRIAIQSGGYGRALYLRHPGERVTVYGHLRQFTPAVEKWVKEQQYQRKSFQVDLYPPDGRFSFGRCQLIAYSGNSGASGGPHLHFEIRDKSASVPLNVLKYDFPVPDGLKPKINWLSIYPLDDSSLVNGSYRNMLIRVSGSNGKYYPATNNIAVSGTIGFGIEAVDYLDNASNTCIPYSFELFVDGKRLSGFVLDSIPFSGSGYMNSHIDYAEEVRTGISIQKLFLDPNNHLSIYRDVLNRGMICFTDTLVHNIRIATGDAYRNRSELNFRVRSGPSGKRPPTIPVDPDVVALFRYDTLNVYEQPDVMIVVPRNALYRDIRFRFSRSTADSTEFSDMFNIHDVYTALYKSYVLSIKPRNVPPALYDKLMIASIGDKGTRVSHGGIYKNGYVTAQVRTFGRFFLALDTISPDIKPVSYIGTKKYTEGQALAFRISDGGSGIRKYTGYIDGQWALFEYDAKRDMLTYVVDGERLQKGRKHGLEIVVTDNLENVSRFTGSFYF